MNSGKVELLDHPRLVAQLAGLERRTARGGRDSIDHAPGGHDDVATAACGAPVLAATPQPREWFDVATDDVVAPPVPPSPATTPAWLQQLHDAEIKERQRIIDGETPHESPHTAPSGRA